MAVARDLVVLGLLGLVLLCLLARMFALIEQFDLLEILDSFGQRILRGFELSFMSLADASRLSRRAMAALAKVE